MLAAVQLVNNTKGIHLTDVAKRLGKSALYVKVLLLTARQLGMIGLLRASRNSLWVPLHLEAPMQKAHDEAAEIRRAETQRRRAENKRRRRAGEKLLPQKTRANPNGEDDESIVQRWAAPADPMPFVCRAPASVFHLGGML